MSGRGGGGGGGRDRYQKDNSRFEERSNSGGRSSHINPPSRHLWVGNLSHSIGEHDLTRHFLQYGDLDSVAFQPGRSYAFINFFRDDDAIAAMKELSGFPLAGNPLRIEFAKADKPPAPSRGEDYSKFRDEQYHGAKGSPFLQESRGRDASPDSFYAEKTKMNDRNTEPSEVLWIGFPVSLKVDEMNLRKAFSPFGDIEKITTFPGRSYAFVRFRSLISASRAKETLQGKLFGNSRVHICFARNESGSSNSGRSSANAPTSPILKSNSRQGFMDNYQPDNNYGSITGDPGIRSQFFSNLESEDSDSYNFNRNSSLWTGGGAAFESRRSGEMESKFGPSPDSYRYHRNPANERLGHMHGLPQRFSQNTSFSEDQWESRDDVYPHNHESKKLKTGSFPPEKELPEYPLFELHQEKHGFPKLYSDFHQSEAFDKKFEAGQLGYQQISERSMKLALPYGETNESLREPYDSFLESNSVPSSTNGRKRFAPESERPSLKEWKWEGTIAKGGTPVCRARCFPVGKIMDMMLPEFLDCTARTSLDMLSKHYYEAASAWVVFFVPGGDSEIGLYNEFMNYLGDKQRAAVAKLDDETTLFLVPPSDFSQKVLKVPGKLSISGVILRLERSGPNFMPENKDSNLMVFHGGASYSKELASSASIPLISDYRQTGVNNVSLPANTIASLSDAYNEDHIHQQNSIGQNWSSHHLQNSNLGIRNIPSQPSKSSIDSIVQDHHQVHMSREFQEPNSNRFSGGYSGLPFTGNLMSTQAETQSAVSLTTATPALQPEQLAQLASSLLGPQRQAQIATNVSSGKDLMHRNTSEHLFGTSMYSSQNNQVNSGLASSQFGQPQQSQRPHQQPPAIDVRQDTAQRDGQAVASSGGEEAEADPQKRLQATLQLAAALLQQIQQGKGS